MALERNEAVDRKALGPQQSGAAEIGQVDDEGGGGHRRAGATDEAHRGERGAGGSDEVVGEEHPCARRAGVDMHGEPVGAIFERIFLGDRLARQLARLADEEQPAAEPLGKRRADDEAAGLDRGDEIGFLPDARRQPLDRGGEAARVEEEGGDVAELDARLGKVRDRANEGPEIRAEIRLVQPSSPSALAASRFAMFSGSSTPVRRTARLVPPCHIFCLAM